MGKPAKKFVWDADTCRSKMAFAHRSFAKKLAQRALKLYGNRQRPYRCGVCERWHLTTIERDVNDTDPLDLLPVSVIRGADVEVAQTPECAPAPGEAALPVLPVEPSRPSPVQGAQGRRMLEVKVIKHDANDGGSREIASMLIVNDGTGNPLLGNYDVAATETRQDGVKLGGKARVIEHPRSETVWFLVKRALEALL